MATKGGSAYGYRSETDHLVEFNKNSPKAKAKRRAYLYGAVALLVVLIGIAALGLAIGLGVNLGHSSTTTLPSRLTISNLMSHLQELERITQENPAKSRAVQYGYNESADMVYDKLKEAGFEDVEKQTFVVATFEENTKGSSLSASFESNEQLFQFNFLQGSQYNVMWYSDTTGGMEITANLSVVEELCNTDNYTADTIALIDYIPDEEVAGCNFVNMSKAANDAGALAIIMMRMEGSENSNVPPRTRVYFQDGDTFLVSELPVMGATYELGKQLKDFLDLSDTATVQVSMSTDTTVNYWTTYNVLAATSNHETGDATIVMGSHLDSVAAGGGINDNGSGSAANLELAIQVVKHMTPYNKVIFAFWTAEEMGLLGSTYYVTTMEEEKRNKIALNLNFDMIASPNFKRMIYNGSGAENENVVRGSENIQSVFEDFFKSKELNYSLTPFTGRSDYGPFIEKGVDIPAGGLFTGADETKTEEDRIKYGGLANSILDPCYHQACDSIDNINEEVFLEMAQAAGYALNEFMMNEDLRGYLES